MFGVGFLLNLRLSNLIGNLFGAFLILLFSSSSQAQEKLVLIGGGARPAQALRTFADWSYQEQGQILIIAWASRHPNPAAQSLIEDFTPHFVGRFDVSLSPPKTGVDQRRFLQQMDAATGIFFSGGNQSRILQVFNEPGGVFLKLALQRKYANGIVVGGTSAGTAVMSQPTILGNTKAGKALLAEGLGLLPLGWIVDQHFSQRKRTKRLLLARKQAGVPFALGIDEDTALIITDNRNAWVSGDHGVHIYESDFGDSVSQTAKLKQGDAWTLDLQSRACKAVL